MKESLEKQILSIEDLNELLSLFCECFSDDHYYMEMFHEDEVYGCDMSTEFKPVLAYCLSNSFVTGIKSDGKLIAFLISLDYKALDENAFKLLFEDKKGEIPYEDTLHKRMKEIPSDVIYLMSIGVTMQYRRKGIASCMLDCLMAEHIDATVVSDVSNEKSLNMYRDRHFSIETLAYNYFLVVHNYKKNNYSFGDGVEKDGAKCECRVSLFVPNLDVLSDYSINYDDPPLETFVPNCVVESDRGIPCFRSKENVFSKAFKISVRLDDLFKYQRLINLSQYEECYCGKSVFYVQTLKYKDKPLYDRNGLLESMAKERMREWAVVPDVFVSIPVVYDSLDRISPLVVQKKNKLTDSLLSDLDFRTAYEAGIPSNEKEVVFGVNINKRIKRFYLGNVWLQIVTESTETEYNKVGDPIGAASMVHMYLTVDMQSHSAVVTLYALSSPFLISHFLDNVVRNSLMVVEEEKKQNIYDYLYLEYGIKKRGSAKSFVMIPGEKNFLELSQIASLLASEIIYSDNASYGRITDSKIHEIIDPTFGKYGDYGMGQYDRAIVYAYTNVILQITPDFPITIEDRIKESSITMFFIELILLEESAIINLDCEINKLLASGEKLTPVLFVKRFNCIYDEFSRTSEFWNIQMNFATSQNSLDIIRNAFRIEDKLNYLKRNQEHLQKVFESRCDELDRENADRMDLSLAFLSVLALFSAWTDGFDFVAKWSEKEGGPIPDTVTYGIQNTLFFIILAVGCFVVWKLFGVPLIEKIKANKKSNKKHRKKQ